MDNLDSDIWVSIGLRNQLKEVTHQMWDAMMDGKTVSISVDGTVIKEFHGRKL